MFFVIMGAIQFSFVEDEAAIGQGFFKLEVEGDAEHPNIMRREEGGRKGGGGRRREEGCFLSSWAPSSSDLWRTRVPSANFFQIGG
jgi:hypothetical protein